MSEAGSRSEGAVTSGGGSAPASNLRTGVASPKPVWCAHRLACSPHRPRRPAMLDGCSARLHCAGRLQYLRPLSTLRNHSRFVRTQARYAPSPSGDAPDASDTYDMRPSGLATPREVQPAHEMDGLKLIGLEVGALPQSVRRRSGECEEGAVCRVRAFVVCITIQLD